MDSRLVPRIHEDTVDFHASEGCKAVAVEGDVARIPVMDRNRSAHSLGIAKFHGSGRNDGVIDHPAMSKDET